MKLRHVVLFSVGFLATFLSIRLVVIPRVAAGTSCQPGGTSSVQPNGRVTVTGCIERTVDGDTLVVAGTKVRLLGVDTPETHDPRKPVQCYGPQAERFTRSFAAGRQATVATEPSTGDVVDRYGRTLGYVHVRGRDLGLVLLERGYAKVYRFAGRRFKRLSRYLLAQYEAETAGRGRWGAC